MTFEEVLPALRSGRKIKKSGWELVWPTAGLSYSASTQHLVNDLCGSDWEIAEEHRLCPFCGKEAHLVSRGEFHYASCSLCGSTGPERDDQKWAWEAWDRRVGS